MMAIYEDKSLSYEQRMTAYCAIRDPEHYLAELEEISIRKKKISDLSINRDRVKITDLLWFNIRRRFHNPNLQRDDLPFCSSLDELEYWIEAHVPPPIYYGPEVPPIIVAPSTLKEFPDNKEAIEDGTVSGKSEKTGRTENYLNDDTVDDDIAIEDEGLPTIKIVPDVKKTINDGAASVISDFSILSLPTHPKTEPVLGQ